MNRISIIPNTDKDKNFETTKKVAEILRSFGKEVCIENTLKITGGDFIRQSRKELVGNDMIVSLGGDGTILDIADEAAKNDTPILGINIGNLGFLSQAECVSADIFEDIFCGKYTVTESMMLHASLMEGGRLLKEFTALNDAVIKGEAARMLNIKVDIDGINTNNYPADGVIISTATGSTAYSLSAGGAIVHPELDAIMITPICPHTLKARCMIIPAVKKVRISLLPPYRSNGVLTVDGKHSVKIEEGLYVEVEKSEHKAKFINLNRRSFYDIVREKIADRSI